MTITAIRERLHNYISIADDKNLEAIYTILEDKIDPALNWDKDKVFLEELDSRVEQYEKDIDKGATWNELESTIEKLRKSRTAK